MNINENSIFISSKKAKKRFLSENCPSLLRINILLILLILISFILLVMFCKIKNYINYKESKLLSLSIILPEKQKSKGTSNENKSKDKRPKIIAITYGNQFFRKQMEFNRKSALEVGQVDEHYSFGPEDIDKDFREKNKEILSKGRGNGLWLWKPYIVNKTMIEKLEEGDYLIYTDAAMIFTNSSYLLIDFLKQNNAEMWFNRLTLKEKKYSKRDAFIIMGLDSPIYSETNQYMAGIQIYKKSNFTIKFIQEWLYYSQDKRIVTEDKNVMGKENYPGFIENRHDQTPLSLLIKKYGVANAGSPNLTLEELQKRPSIIMPNILCMYRRRPFKVYEDIKNMCIKIIEHQNHIFS